MTARVQFVRGGPDAVTGTWPLVLANVLAASLIEMAPVLVRRIGHHGRLVLSGIPVSLEQDVGDAVPPPGNARPRREVARGLGRARAPGVLVTVWVTASVMSGYLQVNTADRSSQRRSGNHPAEAREEAEGGEEADEWRGRRGVPGCQR